MTKKDFLDVIGDIDGKLVESTLDIPRMETVEIPYTRPPVLRYILGAAACAAVLVAVLAVRGHNGVSRYPADNSEPNFISESASGSENSADISDSVLKPDLIRGWNPEDYLSDGICGNAGIGESAVFSAAELDGIKVSLILHDITKLPGEKYSENGHDYSNYYGAKDIVLYITDDKGRKLIVKYLTPHMTRNREIKFIHKNCFVGEGTRLFRFKPHSIGEQRYVLMQIADYDEENDAPIATFYNCRLGSTYNSGQFDENGISANGMHFVIRGFGRIGGWGHGYQVSSGFYQSSDITFTDPQYGYTLAIDPNGDTAYVLPSDSAALQDGYLNFDDLNITGWDSETLPYNDYPAAGESAVVARAELDGIRAELIMINVIKRPGERHYLCPYDEFIDMWAANEICLYITDDQGRKVLGSLNAPMGDYSYVRLLPEKCLFEGSTKIFAVGDGSERDHIIMQYCTVGDDGSTFGVSFVSGDTELYVSTSAKDENGISKGKDLLPIYSVKKILSSSDGTVTALENGKLYDRENGKVITGYSN